MASAIYWLNVDRPTRTARVHEEDCQYVHEMEHSTLVRPDGHPKRVADGAWLRFDSLRAAVMHALRLGRVRLTGCRRCFARYRDPEPPRG